MITNETLVPAERIAEHFGVSIGTVNSWVRRGCIPYLRVTRKTVRFSIVEVETALRAGLATFRDESAGDTSSVVGGRGGCS